MHELTAEEVISQLGLAPLPAEGGYYRETYRSEATLPLSAMTGGDPYDGKIRNAGTAIYYMLTPDTYSALHRLTSDETYHFYRGGAVELTLFDESNGLHTVTLGPHFEKGQHCQYVVPAGVWQGSRLLDGSWALMGTTVAPGFDFADFTLADESLLEQFPEHAAAIKRLLARG
jgi:uncharacterized protein